MAVYKTLGFLELIIEIVACFSTNSVKKAFFFSILNDHPTTLDILVLWKEDQLTPLALPDGIAALDSKRGTQLFDQPKRSWETPEINTSMLSGLDFGKSL